MVRAKATAGKGRKSRCGVSREKTAEVVDERELRTATRVVKRPRNYDNTDNLRGDYTTAAPAKKAAVQKKTVPEVKTEVAASVVEALQRSYYQEVNRVEEPSSSSDVVPVVSDRSPVQLSEEQRKKLTKRQLANLLEKERNGKLIQAYEFLRNALPVIKNGSRPITKLETLTLAKSYIVQLETNINLLFRIYPQLKKCSLIFENQTKIQLNQIAVAQGACKPKPEVQK